MVDFARPWTILNDLEQWREVILELNKKVPPQDQEARRRKLRKFFANYEVPDVDEDGNIDDLPDEPEEK